MATHELYNHNFMIIPRISFLSTHLKRQTCHSMSRTQRHIILINLKFIKLKFDIAIDSKVTHETFRFKSCQVLNWDC
jgi:hypothetical protein